MQDNSEVRKLDPAEGVCKNCKNSSSSILYCIGKRTREGYDHGSEIRTVHSERDRKGPASSSEGTKRIWQKRFFFKV